MSVPATSITGMRLVPTSNGLEVRQVYDVTVCAACDGPLTVPNFRPTLKRCTSHNDHWILECKQCGHPNWDTPCGQPDPDEHPLRGHLHQWGPTLDVGDD